MSPAGQGVRPRALPFQSVAFKSFDPALHRAAVRRKPGDLLTAVAAGDQQQAAAGGRKRDSSERAISCWMAIRMTSGSAISELPHDDTSGTGIVISIIQQCGIICRNV